MQVIWKGIQEFFGWGGYTREPEGYMSVQHLIFVSTLMVVMIGMAVLLGLTHRHKDERQKNRVLMITAIIIDTCELFKIVYLCFRGHDPMGWLYNLPLFLCSIQLIAIPLAAFSKGRMREAALDFVFIFGVLGAVLGTYGAGQNYAAYPVLSFDNVVSGITHSISGFAALYIGFSELVSMKRKNMPITFAILGGFCVAAYLTNITADYNYMFLMQGDGTPYDILYNMAGGHPVFYPLGVVALFVLYIEAFYSVLFSIRRFRSRRQNVSPRKATADPTNRTTK